MKNSCIPHPEREPLIVIRRWQLHFTGDACAAALLSFFEYWHNNKLDNQDKKPGSSLVQHHTAEELSAGIMGLYSRDSIRKAVAKLEKLGVLQVSRNPRAQFGFDRTKHYLFKPEIARNWLKMNTTAKNRTSNCEKSSFPTAKNRQTIPETTSETSYPETTRKEGKSPSKTGIGVFVPPTGEEVQEYMNKHKLPVEAVRSWYFGNRDNGWRINGKRRIHDWRKALMGYVQTYKVRPNDPINDQDLQAFSEEIEVPTELYERWLEWGNRKKWMRHNPRTGKDEPIFDLKGSLAAFKEMVDNQY